MEKELELSPEYKALMRQYEELREELAKLAAEREMLLTTEKRSLETEYYLKVGRKQYELFMLRNEVLRLKRKTEMVRAALNRGEEYDLELIEERLDEELRRWEEEVEELANKIRHAEYIKGLPTLTLEESRELRKLFRDLVRQLHPDLNPEFAEKDKYLWDRILTAYEHGDLQELKALALLAEDREPSRKSITALEELKKAIVKTKEQVDYLLKELEKTRQQFPFTMREKLESEGWVKEQNQDLEKQIGQYQEKKHFYLSLLADLTANSAEDGTLLH